MHCGSAEEESLKSTSVQIHDGLRPQNLYCLNRYNSAVVVRFW